MGRVARKAVFGLSVESVFQCADRPFSEATCQVLSLKFLFGLPLTLANRIDSGESVQIHKLTWNIAVRMCYKVFVSPCLGLDGFGNDFANEDDCNQ